MMKKNHYTVVQIDSQTWRFEEGSGSGRAYMYLLVGNEKAALIDTGFGGGDLRALTASLTKLPVFVINTHGHIDHVSGNYQFDQVFLPALDRLLFEEHISYSKRYVMARELIKEYKLPAFVVKLPGVSSKVKRFCSVPKCASIETFEDGAVFDLGGRTLTAIAMPGHTAGCMCFLERERGYLYSGDTVCAEGVLLLTDGSMPVDTYLNSLKKLESMACDFHTLWPGHHMVPLPPDYINDYIACCESILSGDFQARSVKSAAGKGYMVRKGRIAVSYQNIR